MCSHIFANVEFHIFADNYICLQIIQVTAL
jgi:hypothetical protein